VRWELHRVWVVEANLKPGMRHVYPKRVSYWDEDMPGVGMSDNYDSAGKLYKALYALPVFFYETPGAATDEAVVYDLVSGSYTYQHAVTDGVGWLPTQPKSETFYSSEALAGDGIR
jgi:hypothetical protein